MKAAFACAAVACVALVLAGCGGDAKSQIVGKWETDTPGGKMTAEFAADGTAKMTMPNLGTATGTYKVNGDELEWTMAGITTKGKLKVTATELEMTKDGATIKYKKV